MSISFGAVGSPPQMPHCLQNPKCPPAGQKWPKWSGNWFTPAFRELSFFIRALLIGEKDVTEKKSRRKRRKEKRIVKLSVH